MEEIKMKVGQEVTKNMTVTKGIFLVSSLYNFLAVLLSAFFLISNPGLYDPMFGAALFMLVIGVPMFVISVPVSVISFNRLINFKKLSWDTHRGIFVAFFIVTTSASLLVLSFFFSSIL